jgi:hypothetical protein
MTNSEKPKEIYDKLAGAISVVFHPLFMPLYGLLIIFSAPTLFGYLPFQVKKLLVLIVLVNNVFLPMAMLPFFVHWNIISSWTIDNIKERRIPLAITTVLYGATSFIIYGFPIPVFLKSFIFAASFLSLMVTLITYFWKISLHSVGAGALLSIVMYLSFKMYTPLLWYLIPAIIAGGLVLTSRLRLNSHNPPQVWLGFLSGFAGLILFMLLFK